MQILDKQDGLRKYAGPGHWNDPDMLEVGNGKLTAGEDRAHFTMWAMLAAPLIAGNDLRSMDKHTIEVLTNREVIALNQDPLGVQGLRYSVKDSVETWFKPLQNGDWAVAFLNRNKNKTVSFAFNWQSNIVKDDQSGRSFNAKDQRYEIVDLWKKTGLGNTVKPLAVSVAAHDILVVRLKLAE